ncbi:hypothetical protein [Halioxenophilus sp. WMMB6]|uniref:hypothetical protein n=1 Tax=Halioxenophilus sp. WMMB6 TaxID=3073815 RepID=UPI00295E41C8|nr:hypothetical protein [Halioxenophilus sp. WMMB6]
MASHLTAIGIYSEEELITFMETVWAGDSCRPYPANEPTSFCLPAARAELWLHPAASCFIPTLSTGHTVNVRPEAWLPDDDNHCPFCSLLAVDVLSPDGHLLYPQLLAVGNCEKAQQEITLGKTVALPITAFVEGGEVWPDLAAFQKAMSAEDQGPTIGPGSFFPEGPYAVLEARQAFAPLATFCGVVVATELEANPVTGHRFRLASVECGETIFQCVMDFREFPELTIGNIVYVSSWLSVAS